MAAAPARPRRRLHALAAHLHAVHGAHRLSACSESRHAGASDTSSLTLAPFGGGGGGFGAEARLRGGASLRQPLAPEQAREIYAALVRHKVLVFRAAGLSHAAQQRFARELSAASPTLGPPTIGHPVFGHVAGFPSVYSVYQGRRTRAPTQRAALDRAADAAKHPWTGYHADLSGCVNPPAVGILRADIIPSGSSDTLFSDMGAAYRALDAATKGRIAGLMAEHESATELEPWISQSLYGHAIRDEREMVSHHPLVVLHPDTGEQLLYCSPGLLKSITSMPRDEHGAFPPESEELLYKLWEHAVTPSHTIAHRWSEGDLVVWDQRATIHRAPSDVDPAAYSREEEGGYGGWWDEGEGEAGEGERQLYRTMLAGQPLVGVDGRSRSVSISGAPMLSAEEEWEGIVAAAEQQEEEQLGGSDRHGLPAGLVGLDGNSFVRAPEEDARLRRQQVATLRARLQRLAAAEPALLSYEELRVVSDILDDDDDEGEGEEGAAFRNPMLWKRRTAAVVDAAVICYDSQTIGKDTIFARRLRRKVVAAWSRATGRTVPGPERQTGRLGGRGRRSAAAVLLATREDGVRREREYVKERMRRGRGLLSRPSVVHMQPDMAMDTQRLPRQ
jgi:taurine dioxygenase